MLHAATTLDDAYRTLSPRPLIDADEMAAFYRPQIDELRGGRVVDRLALGLRRAHAGAAYKALLMGHAGVGKSTELARLAGIVSDKFRVVRLSVGEHLDPISFQPFDILLLMASEVATRTQGTIAESDSKDSAESGAGEAPGPAFLDEVIDWYARGEEVTHHRREIAAQATAGAGPAAGDWWARALGFFAQVKGEMKYASVREEKSVRYRLSRIDELVRSVNRLLAQCNSLLRQASGREWLFLFEDFDKAGISPEKTQALFVTYGNVIRELDAHIVFTIPIALGYSAQANALPVPRDRQFVLPDTMVFDRWHRPHTDGRAAVRAVLTARLAPELFAAGQAERLVVASGGNLRNLFAMAGNAADSALLRGARQIEADDAQGAIRQLRTDYERQLGESP
ncbi:MAG TPA: hypothetical protein PKN13_10630, partial [Accumulibacter sp.]|nr:hypothetical protein [Accumulibacter sp.]